MNASDAGTSILSTHESRVESVTACSRPRNHNYFNPDYLEDEQDKDADEGEAQQD